MTRYFEVIAVQTEVTPKIYHLVEGTHAKRLALKESPIVKRDKDGWRSLKTVRHLDGGRIMKKTATTTAIIGGTAGDMEGAPCILAAPLPADSFSLLCMGKLF
jgi:hypothetical protein